MKNVSDKEKRIKIVMEFFGSITSCPEKDINWFIKHINLVQKLTENSFPYLSIKKMYNETINLQPFYEKISKLEKELEKITQKYEGKSELEPLLKKAQKRVKDYSSFITEQIKEFFPPEKTNHYISPPSPPQ